MFHLSIPVDDLDRAKAFYVDILGCTVGREAPGRFDIDFFDHFVHLIGLISLLEDYCGTQLVNEPIECPWMTPNAYLKKRLDIATCPNL